MNRHARRKADAQARKRGPRVEGEHNYMRPMIEAMANHPPERGRVTLCNIWHHECCDIYRGGLCNCDPQIEFQPLAKPGEVN